MFLPLAPSLFSPACSSTPTSGEEEERDNLQLAGCCGRKLAFSGSGGGRKEGRKRSIFFVRKFYREMLFSASAFLSSAHSKKELPFSSLAGMTPNNAAKKKVGKGKTEWLPKRNSPARAHCAALEREKKVGEGREGKVGEDGSTWFSLLLQWGKKK